MDVWIMYYYVVAVFVQTSEPISIMLAVYYYVNNALVHISTAE